MKRVLLSFIIISIIICLTGCALFSGTNVYGDHERCDKLMEDLTSSLLQKDNEKAKKLFAPRLYSDSMFDSNLQSLIDYYSGETQSINGGVDTGEHSDFNYEEKHHGMEYIVVTDVDTFRFSIVFIEKDTRNKNDVGIINLYVLKLSEDEYPDERYFGALISTDGIHVAYPHELPSGD